MKAKSCPKCKEKLPLTSDYFHRNRSKKGGFSSACKKCRTTSNRKRQYTFTSRETKWKGKLKLKFNLTLEQYDQMLEQQNGKCAICNQIDVSGKRLSVDHDHQTGKIRGLLCMNCNLLLGRVESTPELFSKMMKYLDV